MPTTPSSLVSPNGEKTSEILKLRGDLNESGIDPHRLILLFLGANEMVIGEDQEYDHQLEFEGRNLPETVILKNPKRLMRLQGMDRATGSIHTELRFGDFDMVMGGEVLLKHSGGFRLHWLDDESQVNYLKSYRGFIESRRVASAKAAGIHIPGIIA